MNYIITKQNDFVIIGKLIKVNHLYMHSWTPIQVTFYINK